jgi:hypothetical protein
MTVAVCHVGKIEAQVKEIMESQPMEQERKFFWHWQNLGKGRKSSETKGLWREGRAWWHFEDAVFRIEWHLLSAVSTGADFDFAGEEDDFKVHVSIKRLFAFWVAFSGLPILRTLFRDIRESFGYETGFNYHSSTLYIRFAHSDAWGSRSIDFKYLPKWVNVYEGMTYKERNWWHGFYVSIDLADAFLGREKHSAEDVGEPAFVEFHLSPDTDLGQKYIVKVQIQRHTWKRPRWFLFEQMRAHYECQPPIPMPGKGESDWDQGDDAIFGGWMNANTPEAAVRLLMARVKNTRERYGLPNSILEKVERLR